MKASPLVQQLTEARPRKPKAVPNPAEQHSSKDELKGELISTYETDWRFRAIDEFNMEENLSLHLDDNKSDEEDRMRFEDGDTTWEIYQNEEVAEAQALVQVRDQLESEPELFSADFIKNHINQDKLKNTLWQDVREHRSDDFDEMSDDDKADVLERAGVISDTSEVFVSRKEFVGIHEKQVAQLFSEFIDHLKATVTDKAAVAKGFKNAQQFIQSESTRLSKMDDEDFVKALIADSGFPIDEDDYFTDEQSGINEEVIDSLKEAYLDKLGTEFDPMDWLNDIYGDEEAQKEAIKIGGIDIDEAAKEAVSTDGWSHFLNGYDGGYSTLPCDAVYFRSN